MKQRSRLASAVAVVFAICLMACGSPVEPVVSVWKSIGLEGTEINALESTPWGVFAATRTYGIFKRTPHGWAESGLQGRTVTSLHYVDAAPAYLLAGLAVEIHTPADANTYYSTDGTNWLPRDGLPVSAARTAPAILALDADPNDARRIVAGVQGMVLLSEDGGVSWRASYAATPGNFGPAFRTVATDGASVWASGYDGQSRALMVRSDDWGKSWDVESDISFFPLGASTEPTRLWVADREGLGYLVGPSDSFTRVFGYAPERGGINAFDARGDVMCAASYAHLFCTSDGGNSWLGTRTPEGITASGPILVDSPEGVMIASEGRGVWLLRDF